MFVKINILYIPYFTWVKLANVLYLSWFHLIYICLKKKNPKKQQKNPKKQTKKSNKKKILKNHTLQSARKS